MSDIRPTAAGAILAYIVGAIALGAAAGIGAHFGGRVFWPNPIMVVIPAWFLVPVLFGNVDADSMLLPPSLPFIIAGALPFIIVGVPLLLSKSKAVWPTLLFVALLVVCSIVYFGTAWSDGVQWQGFGYTVTVALINAAAAALCVWLALRAHRARTFWLRYVAALISCAWLVWCAFPWLGEIP